VVLPVNGAHDAWTTARAHWVRLLDAALGTRALRATAGYEAQSSGSAAGASCASCSRRRCQVVRVIRRQALTRLVTQQTGISAEPDFHATAANAVVSETTSHSRQRRRITVR
jgi:hypothetical protein